MEYIFSHSEIEQNLAKQAIRAGQPLPARIANAPKLRLGLQIYMQAFFDLDAERAHGMGLTPIPWTSIAEYAKVFNFNSEQRENLFLFIRRMDNSHLNRLAEKNKPNGAQSSTVSRQARQVGRQSRNRR